MNFYRKFALLTLLVEILIPSIHAAERLSDTMAWAQKQLSPGVSIAAAQAVLVEADPVRKMALRLQWRLNHLNDNTNLDDTLNLASIVTRTADNICTILDFKSLAARTTDGQSSEAVQQLIINLLLTQHIEVLCLNNLVPHSTPLQIVSLDLRKLNICNNPALSSLSGLNAPELIVLYSENNPALTSLAGLNAPKLQILTTFHCIALVAFDLDAPLLEPTYQAEIERQIAENCARLLPPPEAPDDTMTWCCCWRRRPTR